MRASKWLATVLAVLVASSAVSGCTSLRTPYERQKMKEAGGETKKKKEGEGEKKKGEEEKKSGAAEISGKPEQDKEKKTKEGKAETKAQREERKKGQGILYVIPHKLQDTAPKLMYSKSLSEVVSQSEGVANGTVLLDEEHNAYVAISAPNTKADEITVEENKALNVKTEGEIPKPLQEKVATNLRKADSLVDTVYITNNPRHAEDFNRYAEKAMKDDINDVRSKALAEHIQDIWK